MVKCELCGKELKQVTSTHILKCAGISMQEYKKLYPDSKITEFGSNPEHSEFMKKRWQDPAYREKTKNSYKGKKSSMKGKKHSQKAKDKMSRKKIGNTNALGHIVSEEVRIVLKEKSTGNTNALGHIVSEETREIQSKNTKKLWEIPEFREKVLDALKDRNISGKNNGNWKGGVSFNYGSNWNEMRNLARKRDNYTCQFSGCGITKDEQGEEMSVHHIIRFDDYGLENYERANRLCNLISLCRLHHLIIEHHPELLEEE